jgi:integrase/recombinase XerD
MYTNLTLSQAVTGYEIAATARRLSPNTLAEYNNTYRKFAAYLKDDLIFDQITRQHLTGFLASCQTVTQKTLLNYHVGLASLYTWAVKEGIVQTNLLHLIDRPKPEKRIIKPLTETEIRALILALTYSATYARPGKRPTRHRLPEADRNLAMLLVLLDTGIRASEICHLLIRHVDLRSPNKSITIHEGKGKKDRQIPISARTAQVVWKYLATRPAARVDQPLFVTDTNRPLDRCQLAKMLAAAGERAKVSDPNPHRFRHTFAICYLRNGGDIYTLQMILGHTSLDMVRIYLQIAEADLENAHRKASPVDNMHL